MLVEHLESRRLLAVTVANNGGALTVTGDDGDNFVGVFLKDEDTLVVRTATVTPVEEETGGDDAANATASGIRRMGPIPPFELDDVATEEFDISDDGITSIVIDLGAGNDRAAVGHRVELDAEINGGEGDDKLTGGAGDDTVNGDAGNDHVRGGPGADSLNGGDGNDSIDAADGVSDTVDGGADTTDADGTSGDRAAIDAADGDTPDTVTNVESTRTGLPGGPGGPGHHPGPGRGPRPAPPTDETPDDGTTAPPPTDETAAGETPTPPADGETPTQPRPHRPGGPRPGGPRPDGPRPAPGEGDGTVTDTVLNVGGVDQPVRLSVLA